MQLAKMAEDLMAERVSDDDGEITEELIENDGLPFEVACRLAEHWGGDEICGYLLCRRRDATPEVLDYWLDREYYRVKRAVADHPNASVVSPK